MLAEARKIGIRLHGEELMEFNDIKKWWKTADPNDENTKIIFSIIYEPFEKGWDKVYETKFMKLNKWEYSEESKERAHNIGKKRCINKTNLELKGCVQQLISYVKTDLCNQIRDSGKYSEHGTNITKTRKHEEERMDSNGKYKKLKKGEFTVSLWTNDKMQKTAVENLIPEVEHPVNEAQKQDDTPEKNVETLHQQPKDESPESYKPSTAERRRNEKVARNKAYLKEKGLDLSIGQLAKLYNNNNNKKRKGKNTYYVEKIINHRKHQYKKGDYEVEIKWKNYDHNNNTWEDLREKIIEVPDTFKEYYVDTSDEFQSDFEDYLVLYPELKVALGWETGCKGKDNSVTPESVKSVTEIASKKEEKITCECDKDHSKLMNYITESNPSFCKPGFYLYGKMCSGQCGGLFDEANKGVVEEQLWIKPSIKAPVWVCQGMVNKGGCMHAFCFVCAKNMMAVNELV
jgi:hypothetical protein